MQKSKPEQSGFSSVPLFPLTLLHLRVFSLRQKEGCRLNAECNLANVFWFCSLTFSFSESNVTLPCTITC